MNLWHQIEQELTALQGHQFKITEKRSIGGGSINHAYRISNGSQDFFLKTNSSDLYFMFAAEARALQVLSESQTITVPEPVAHGIEGNESFFVMTWVDMSGRPDSRLFARQLAALHSVTSDRFGFFIDNSIGSTLQPNGWMTDWVEFWQNQRIGHQLELAKRNGFGHRLYDRGIRLNERADELLGVHCPTPSLLHGDLWSGNWAGDSEGRPVIFDPASYYGDSEADLAMMELFGGPGREFFSVYNSVRPIEPGYDVRKTLYNLYHILNHANLFGSSYAMQAERMIDSLLAELG